MMTLSRQQLNPTDSEVVLLQAVIAGQAINPYSPMQPGVREIVNALQSVHPQDRAAMLKTHWPLTYERVQYTPAPPPRAPEPRLELVQPRQREHLILADALKELPTPQYALDTYPIYLKSLNALVGPSGAGKSFVAVDIAGRMATAGARVVYIAGEGLFGYSSRWEVWKAHQGLQECPNLVFWDSPVNFIADDEFGAFLGAIASMQPALVIVDTVARCMAGADENSTRDMGLFIASCDRITHHLGAGVLAVHHTGKDGKMRGSSALFGACDSVLFLSRTEQQITVFNTHEQGGKNKYSEEASPQTLQLTPKSVQRGEKRFESAVLLATQQIALNPVEDRLTTNQRLILEAIEAYDNGLKASQIMEATLLSSSSVYKTLKALQKYGWVTSANDTHQITESGLEKLCNR